MEKILDKIIKYSLYLLVFLLPLFFLPWTVFPVAQNKQALLAVFCFLIIIFWAVKIFNLGKFSFIWNRLTLSILLLLFVLGISTLFSASKVQSFFGMSFEPDTLFNFILYGLTFILFANLLKEKEEISKVIFAFLVSSGILSLLFLIQSFWKIFPWDFAKALGFNPIGSVQALAVFLGGAFLILMAIITNAEFKRIYKILGGILGLLLFICLLLINFWVVWLGIIFGMAIIIFSMLKNLPAATSSVSANPLKSVALPLLICVLALVFLFIKLPVSKIINFPFEISPTYKATIDISIKTLREGSKNLIFGSGPATFGYQYSLHRGIGPNFTDFWYVRFDQGAATLPTFLATWGALGVLLTLLMMGFFFWQGVKTLMRRDNTQMSMPTFVGGFYFLFLWFFYSANFSLMFAAFLMIGLFIVATSKPAREFLFTRSPQKSFFIMLACLFLIAGSIIGFYDIYKKYSAGLAYAQGIRLINAQTPNLDEGITKINKAVTSDPKDLYFRNLSQAFLLKINEVLNSKELSQEEKQKAFQQSASDAELSATRACQINSQDSQNWFQLGTIYENLAFIGVEGTDQLAVLNYKKAAGLDPQNPQIYFNIGRVYKTTAEKAEAKIVLLEQAKQKDEEAIKKLEETKGQNLELSLDQFKKSIELKNNFTPSYYLMAQVYEDQGKKDEALKNYLIVFQLEPGNKEIKAKIEELEKSEK